MSKQLRKPDYEHKWRYPHSIYETERGATRIRRYCSVCAVEQVGHVTRWRPPREGEFDHPADEQKGGGDER